MTVFGGLVSLAISLQTDRPASALAVTFAVALVLAGLSVWLVRRGRRLRHTVLAAWLVAAVGLAVLVAFDDSRSFAIHDVLGFEDRSRALAIKDLQVVYQERAYRAVAVVENTGRETRLLRHAGIELNYEQPGVGCGGGPGGYPVYRVHPRLFVDAGGQLKGKVTVPGQDGGYVRATGLFASTCGGGTFRLTFPIQETIPARDAVRLTIELPTDLKTEATVGIPPPADASNLTLEDWDGYVFMELRDVDGQQTINRCQYVPDDPQQPGSQCTPTGLVIPTVRD